MKQKTYEISANKQLNSVVVMQIKATSKKEALEKANNLEYDEIDEYDENADYTEFAIDEVRK